MAASSLVYGFADYEAYLGNIKWTVDTIKMALMGSGYTPAIGTDHHWSDVSSNEITGTGYSAGGATLASCTAVETAANSWSLTWAATHAYVAGDVVKPSGGNGFLYMCVAAGTSGGSAPTFPTVYGQTVVDSGVTWCCMGSTIIVFSSGSVSWTTSTITAYSGVIYDAQSGTSTTEPLINVQTFASAETDTNGTFVVAPDATYGWFYKFS